MRCGRWLAAAALLLPRHVGAAVAAGKTDGATGVDEWSGEGVAAPTTALAQGAMSGIVGAFKEDLAQRSAADQHTIMKQFMKNFARNMRYSVLSDSEGDMPEDRRLAMMHEIEEQQGGNVPTEQPHDISDDYILPPHRANAGSYMAPPPGAEEPRAESQEPIAQPIARAPRRRHRHMLNQGSTHHKHKHHKRGGRHMLNGNSKQAAEEVEAEAAPSAPAMDAREAHKRFMQQLNSCTDEECVKQAYARRRVTHESALPSLAELQTGGDADV